MNFVIRFVLATALILGAAYSTTNQFGSVNKTPMVASGDPVPMCPPSGCKGGVNF